MRYVVGDIHGCLMQLIQLLHRTHLTDALGNWTAGESQLFFLGDYTDRGPDGIGVIDYIMQLQQQAQEQDGKVTALLGNHDVMLLSAARFPDEPLPSLLAHNKHITFYDIWKRNGGLEHDMQRLTEAHMSWLANLPAMVISQNQLLVHADNTNYFQLGSSINDINEIIQKVIWSGSTEGQDLLCTLMTERHHFIHQGADTMQRLCDQLEVSRIVHGHTPIFGLLDMQPATVTEPLIYNNGLCVNMDHALWRGGLGFVMSLDTTVSNLFTP